MRQLFICFILALLLGVGTSCYDDPDWEVNANVPYFESTSQNSAAHCIALWSAADRIWAPEDNIALGLNCLSQLDCFTAMEYALFAYTNSLGYIFAGVNSDTGQNQALAVIRSSLSNNSPSIINAFDDLFFVVIGARGIYEGNRKVATDMRFHLMHRGYHWRPIGEVKSFYVPIHGNYLALIGEGSFVSPGLQSYQQFVNEGGTYLGAPKNYSPSTNPYPN